MAALKAFFILLVNVHSRFNCCGVSESQEDTKGKGTQV